MPSKSRKQHNFMAAVAHGWSPPGKKIKPSVGKEYLAADKKAGKFKPKSAKRKKKK